MWKLEPLRPGAKPSGWCRSSQSGRQDGGRGEEDSGREPWKLRWGDHILRGETFSGKPRVEERLHLGCAGLVRLRRVQVGGDKVAFRHSRLGAQPKQRDRS